GQAIHMNLASSLNLENSIVWGDGEAAQIFNPSEARLSVSGSIIKSGAFGSTSADPLLTPDGFLRKGSPAIDLGVGSDHVLDIHHEIGTSSPDAGADEFLDADDDGIPDWLESLGIVEPLADNDSDGISNIEEYQVYGTNPLVGDTDGD